VGDDSGPRVIWVPVGVLQVLRAHP